MRLDLGPKVLNFGTTVKLGILGGREKYKNAEFISKKWFLASQVAVYNFNTNIFSTLYDN